MSSNAWISVKPLRAADPSEDTVRGVRVRVAISPYDLPVAYRCSADRSRGVLSIEFKYPDEEPGKWSQIADCVSARLGVHSRKLLAINVQASECGWDSVQFDLSAAVRKADQALKQLREASSRPSARLNYEAVDELLEGAVCG